MNPSMAYLVRLISITENRLSTLFYLAGSGEFSGKYVLVSSARTANEQNEETCIFIADESGEPIDWVALYRRMDFDQDEALKSFGYPRSST
jgi:hypothetical protein